MWSNGVQVLVAVGVLWVSLAALARLAGATARALRGAAAWAAPARYAAPRKDEAARVRAAAAAGGDPLVCLGAVAVRASVLRAAQAVVVAGAGAPPGVSVAANRVTLAVCAEDYPAALRWCDALT